MKKNLDKEIFMKITLPFAELTIEVNLPSISVDDILTIWGPVLCSFLIANFNSFIELIFSSVRSLENIVKALFKQN